MFVEKKEIDDRYRSNLFLFSLSLSREEMEIERVNRVKEWGRIPRELIMDKNLFSRESIFSSLPLILVSLSSLFHSCLSL